jgi:hypothetical protein
MLYINQFSGCVMKLTDESDIWIELKLGFLWYLPLIMKSLLDIYHNFIRPFMVSFHLQEEHNCRSVSIAGESGGHR